MRKKATRVVSNRSLVGGAISEDFEDSYEKRRLSRKLSSKREVVCSGRSVPP